MDEILVTIIDWEKFNPRRDVKKSSWFRFEHDFFERWEFFDFNPDEIVFWIYLLCQASHRNQAGVVTVNIEHAHRVGKIEKNTVHRALQKLQKNRVVEVRTSRGRYAHVSDPGCTRRDVTLRDETRRYETELHSTGVEPPEAAPPQPENLTLLDGLTSKKNSPTGRGLPELARLWNELAFPVFPRVKSMDPKSTRYKACVARWREKPDLEYWAEVISRINASDFCAGKGRTGWVADIEFLTRVETHNKILEGKYDNRALVSLPPQQQQFKTAAEKKQDKMREYGELLAENEAKIREAKLNGNS